MLCAALHFTLLLLIFAKGLRYCAFELFVGEWACNTLSILEKRKLKVTVEGDREGPRANKEDAIFHL